MNVSFLCNSFLALPSANFLFEQGNLVGLATSTRNVLLGNEMARFAASTGLPFSQIGPDTLEQDLKTWISTTNPDAVVVQTFPHLIPSSCLDLPPLGFYNIHPSPLPTYRGPDPVFWQLSNSEKEGGVTIHKMSSSFDTGPVFHIEPVSIVPTDTYGILQSNLSYAAVDALQKFVTCDAIDANLSPQTEGAGHNQAKPDTTDLMIDWSQQSAQDIQSLVQACNPNQNGAITFFRDVLTRVLETQIHSLDRIPKLPPGSIIAADETRGLHVLCADNLALSFNILHVEEGYYSGRRFCEVFETRLGEKFCNPSFLS